MPILFAPLVALALGMSLAWGARDSLRERDVGIGGGGVLGGPFAAPLGFAFFVFAPVTGYFAAFHGDWSYLYLVPSARIPSAIDLAFTLISAACVPFGFVLATPSSRARRAPHFGRLVAAPVVVLIVLASLFSKRLTMSASYTQFHGAFGESAIDQSPLGQGVLLAFVALAAGFFWAFRIVRKTARS